VLSRRYSLVKPRRIKKIPCGALCEAGGENPTHPEGRGGENPDPPKREREQEQRQPTHPAGRERNLPAKISHLVGFYVHGILPARQILPARPPFFSWKVPAITISLTMVDVCSLVSWWQNWRWRARLYEQNGSCTN
jgi:hypothetical protein